MHMRWLELSDAELIGTSTRASRVEFDFGTLTLAEPVGISQAPIALVLPGFTGNAWTHTAFIRSALANRLAVLCVTPKWATSANQILANNDALSALVKEESGLVERLKFVRGVSFGAYLSLEWLRHLRSVSKIAWVTPCSLEQLPHAANLMRVDLTLESAPRPDFVVAGLVRIPFLRNDAIVPEIDPIFRQASGSTFLTQIQGADHFTAGETPEAADQIARWFGGSP